MKLEILLMLLASAVIVRGHLYCYICEDCKELGDQKLQYCGPPIIETTIYPDDLILETTPTTTHPGSPDGTSLTTESTFKDGTTIRTTEAPTPLGTTTTTEIGPIEETTRTTEIGPIEETTGTTETGPTEETTTTTEIGAIEETTRTTEIGPIEETTGTTDTGPTEETIRTTETGPTEETTRTTEIGAIEETTRTTEIGPIEETTRTTEIGAIEETTRTAEILPAERTLTAPKERKNNIEKGLIGEEKTNAVPNTEGKTTKTEVAPANEITRQTSISPRRFFGSDRSLRGFACFSIKVLKNGDTVGKVNRGCLPIPINENGCAVYHNLTGLTADETEDCRFCQNTGCNGSAIARLSALAILLMLLLQFLH